MIRALEKKLEEAKANGSGDGGRTYTYPPCKHCGKHHEAPEDEYWSLETNKDKLPKNYKGEGPAIDS